MVSEVSSISIWSKAARSNPQAIYARMREEQPIFPTQGPVSGARIWFFTRYDDVVNVLKDQRFIKDIRKNLAPELARPFLPEDSNPMFEAIERHLLNLDAPDHTRLRQLVHHAFTPRRVRDLEPRIAAIAEDLLQKMATKSSGDLIEDYAFPLPITVIAEMLGVHADKREKFREWTRALLFGASEEAALISVMEFVQYINELIDERRERDTDDILSALVRIEENGDRLDHTELLSMVFVLLVAGHETTVNLIANGMLLLFQHPQQMALLKSNPDLMGSALEEMLRYNGPVETPTQRWASQDIEISGVTIAAGDMVLPSLLAANRDPDVFANPDTFDIQRDPNPHVAFGQGVHYCLGAPLARLEGTIAIQALLNRFPEIRLNTSVDRLEWGESILIHGMKALPVAWS
jgi:cytochrome P450 PksS